MYIKAWKDEGEWLTEMEAKLVVVAYFSIYPDAPKKVTKIMSIQLFSEIQTRGLPNTKQAPLGTGIQTQRSKRRQFKIERLCYGAVSKRAVFPTFRRSLLSPSSIFTSHWIWRQQGAPTPAVLPTSTGSIIQNHNHHQYHRFCCFPGKSNS
jgi:hypothetical protein